MKAIVLFVGVLGVIDVSMLLCGWLLSGFLAERHRPASVLEQCIPDELPSAKIDIDELDRRIAWGDDDLVEGDVIDLPSRRPTWRELGKTLALYGYLLDLDAGPERVRIRRLPRP